jgi:cytoskeleton protein RodZ
MTDFGTRLRQQRESREITLDEIAESSKIGKRYLEALESNDFAALPGGVFTKGYLRTYAEAIGIDPEPLLEDYLRERRELDGGDPTEDEGAAHDAAQAALSKMAGNGAAPQAGPRLPIRSLVLAVLALGLVAILAWASIRWFRSDGEEPGPASVAEKTEPARGEPVAKNLPPPDGRRPDRAADQPVKPVPAATTAEAKPGVDEHPEVEARAPAAGPARQAAEIEPPAEAPAPAADKVEPAPAVVEQAERPPAEPAPPTGPPVETTGAAGAVESKLSVSEFGVGTGVVDRELVGRSQRFAAGTRVWFWNRVLGGSPGTKIQHVWLREGREVGVIDLDIGGSHWRTQSRWTLPADCAGSWSVEARDSGGRVLAKAEFACE